jgi:tRNA modification GTPase
MLNNTIVALSTPFMESAIAVIRLSGNDAIDIVNKMFTKDLTNAKSQTIHYGYLKYNDEIIDEVMVSVFRAPRTYTCENMVEIATHGSLIIINKVISACVSLGASIAERGEFTKRAYLNGRIDLIQAESINDIIHSDSEEAINIALSGLKGNVSSLVKNLKTQVEDVIGNMEVNIDYPEYYDIEVETNETILPKVDKLLLDIDVILNEAKIGMLIKNGIKTAIIGKPNVGKSSLLNAFLGKNKAIVTNIPGTTRDIVEGSINLNGIKLDLLDTAGIHESTDEVENIGINKSKESLDEAELILLVLDASNELSEEDKELLELTKDKTRIIVLNKCDLNKKLNIEGIEISAINQDISLLKDKIINVLGFDIKDYKNKALLTSSRQIGLINKTKDALLNIKELINESAPFDILSVDMKIAYDSLKEILGEISSLGYDDVIFSKFCVGK